MVVSWALSVPPASLVVPRFTFWQPGYEFNPTYHKVMVYILVGIYHQRRYIGCTKDIHHRLRQHNGEIVGGAAKTAKHRPWTPMYIVTGFTDRHQALRFEKRLQHSKVKKGKMSNREWGFRAIIQLISQGDGKGKMAWPVLTIYCF